MEHQTLSGPFTCEDTAVLILVEHLKEKQLGEKEMREVSLRIWKELGGGVGWGGVNICTPPMEVQKSKEILRSSPYF